MKNLLIIALIVVVAIQGCGSLGIVIRGKESQEERTERLKNTGGEVIIYGDVLLGYVANWDKDENIIRNMYQGNFAGVGLFMVDGLIAWALTELFYKPPDEKPKQKAPVNQDEDK